MATSNFDPNDNCKWWICLFTTSSNGERWCRHQLLASCEFCQKFSDFDHIRYPSNCQPQICIIHIHDSQMIIVGNVWIIFSQTLWPHSSKCHFPRSEKEKCDCFLTRGMVYRWKTMMTFIALMVMLMMNTVLMLMLMMSTVLMMICDYLKVGDLMHGNGLEYILPPTSQHLNSSFSWNVFEVARIANRPTIKTVHETWRQIAVQHGPW